MKIVNIFIEFYTKKRLTSYSRILIDMDYINILDRVKCDFFSHFMVNFGHLTSPWPTISMGFPCNLFLE